MDNPEVNSEDTELKSRPYQAQLEEIAVNKNTIIHLPTGSGKTFIAARLIKRFREALKKPWGQGGKRTFFLVNTVPLVNQQKEVIKTMCPVTVVGYSSEDGVDYWNKLQWDAELAANQVFVMTSQILCDMLQHTYIKIEDINLIIFDECHHAVENHPMREIMKHFESCHPSKHPRVLGLTATLLNANVKLDSIPIALRELETTFHATIATVNEMGEVLNYSTNPQEQVQYYKQPTPNAVVLQAIQRLTELHVLIGAASLPQAADNRNIKLEKGQHNISNDPKKIIKAVRNMVTSMKQFVTEMGAYGGSLAILAYVILLERLKRKSSGKEEALLYAFTISHSTEVRMILLEGMKDDKGFDRILKHTSHKFLVLLNILKEFNPKILKKPGVLFKVNHAKKPLTAIIFVEQRFTAKILYNALKFVVEVNPEFDFLKHEFLVGFNIDPYKNTREQHLLKKTSHQALLKFGKEVNCIISTNVIEEGVDIPQCSLVVRYDMPKDYRSYIQSKGRARSKESSFVMLVDESDRLKFSRNYNEFQKTEDYIQRLLVGSSDDRNIPSMNDIKANLYKDSDLEPYVTPSGVRLTDVAATSLLSRYCNTLPHDIFTTLAPMWIQEMVHQNNMAKRLITIIMPLGCPLKEPIMGIPCVNTKIAKRAAALNACIQLHKKGYLDSKTVLPIKYTSVDFDNTDVSCCFPNWPADDTDANKDLPKAGSKKRKRKHNIMFPSYLKQSPRSTTYCLHLIKLSAAFPEPKDSRERQLYHFIKNSSGFGLLSPAPLPKLCDFPTFLTVGEVATSLEVNYAVIDLGEQLMEMVKEFHFFIFDQVLSIAKKFLVFDGTENCLFVVPVRDQHGEGFDIDWEVIQEYNEIPPIEVPSLKERTAINPTQENYKGAVVTPWYDRGDLSPAWYIVSNVIEHMTPQSQLGDSDDTFADYYKKTYNLEVVGNKHQPLLEVRNISSRMNCLLPRAATIRSLTEKQQRLVCQSQGDDRPKAHPEFFVAEFCVKFEFPGVLWYKAMMLPSIIHRVHMLLVAQELLAQISKDTGYGTGVLRKNQNWLPIEVLPEVVLKSLLSQIEDSTPIATVDRINNAETGKASSIFSMKKSIYELQKKKLNKQYPWDDKMEPLDIERHLESATMMDVECYDEFVSTLAPEARKAPSPKRPPMSMPTTMKALGQPPAKYVDKINILSTKPIKGPELRDMVAALTVINSHDTFNLERAETLGDSFLKFAATLYLYHKFPKLNEGQLTNIKGRLISNRNLYYAGERINLGGRMKIEQLSARKDFLVPGFFAPKKVRDFIAKKQIRPIFLIGVQVPHEEALSGQLSQNSWAETMNLYETSKATGSLEMEPEDSVQNAMQCYLKYQAVSDKSVADSVEALIGTYLISGGILGAIKVLEWLRVFPPEDKFELYLKKSVSTPISEGLATEADINYLMHYDRADVENIIGYKFKDPSYLLEALTHSSYISNRKTQSYERLEFLGDAILDFLVTSHMYENCRDLKPGDMTDLRSALVNNNTFASYLVKLGLHKFICSELNPSFDNAIMEFVKHQEERNHEIIDDVLYLIFEEECHIAEYVEVPKVLSDVFEALAGAIFLDSGGDLATVWRVFYKIMHKEIHSFSLSIPKQAVKVLYERIHACPSFGDAKVIDPDTPRIMVPVRFTKNDKLYTVYGVGQNKSNAKRAAAKLALKFLSEN